MPTRTIFNEHALTYLISPAASSPSLGDPVQDPDTSINIETLSTIGRTFLRCCIGARMLNQPISKDFQEKVDVKLENTKLAHVAQITGLLERLEVGEVATDTGDCARVLCAYVGATLVIGWDKSAKSCIDDSVSDICFRILEEPEGENSATTGNSSHERGTKCCPQGGL